MTAFQGQKLVHLDLKGAPPKVEFLLRLIPLLREWGATGILLEYEDMFPYRGESLQVLSKDYCYSFEDIRRLQQVSENENLTFIPLVQTFGHMEFVLKHKRFNSILETANNPMSLCPLHKAALQLVKSIVDQMIEAHEELKYLHVGGDEVWKEMQKSIEIPFLFETLSLCFNHILTTNNNGQHKTMNKTIE